MFRRALAAALLVASPLAGNAAGQADRGEAPGTTAPPRAVDADAAAGRADPGAGGPGAPAGLVLHHGRPRAGAALTLIVEGATPGELVSLVLSAAREAPPSLVAALAAASTVADSVFDEATGTLATFHAADERGLVVVSARLDRADDAGRDVTLFAASGALASATLRLRVQPPLLVLPSEDGLERIDLRFGARLLPPIAGGAALRGAALSADGITGWLLREGGRLTVHDAGDWRTVAPEVALPVTSEGLAAGPSGGPAFVLDRPLDLPFAPAARALFVDALPLPAADADAAALVLGPMGRDVSGRRWALADDGRLAFVAEDDLLVREIDLAARRSVRLHPVGRVVDGAVEDMLVAGRHLLVVTGRRDAAGGTLTSLDLDTGELLMTDLAATPARLARIDDETAFVVPAGGPSVAVVSGGGVAGAIDAPAGSAWLDVAVGDGGPLLLRRDAAGGFALDGLDAARRPVTLRDALPPCARVIAAGFDVAVLLGAPDGRVRRVALHDGAVEVVDGVAARPGAPFVVLD